MKSILTRLSNSFLIKNLVIAASGGLLLRLAPMIFTPITINILTPNDYGLLSLLHTFISMFATISGLGLRQAFYVEFVHLKSIQRKYTLNHIMIIFCIAFIPSAVVTYCLRSQINTLIFGSIATNNMIIICIISCFLYFFTEIFFQILMLKNNTCTIIINQLIATVITGGLSALFLIVFKWGVFGMILAYCIGMNTPLIPAAYHYLKKKYFNIIDTQNFKQKTYEYLKIGLPFIPSMLLAWILSVGDRWVLAAYSDLQDVGIYALAEAFGQLYQMIIITPINIAYLPFLLNKFAENRNNPELVEQWNNRNMFYAIAISVIIITIGCTIFRPILFYVLPLKYHTAIPYIWPILISYTIWMGSYFNLGLILFMKKTKFHALALIIPSFTNLAINFLIVPKLKIYGCVISTMISYVIYFFVTSFYKNSLLKPKT